MILWTYHNLVLSRQEQTENIKHLHFVHKLKKEENITSKCEVIHVVFYLKITDLKPYLSLQYI